MINHFKIISYLVCFLTILSGVERVQAEVKYHTTMSSKSFYVGEGFIYEILVSGAKKVDVQAPDDTDDLRIQWIENIKVPSADSSLPPQIAVRYRMVPMRPGDIHIPVFEINADGASFLTREQQFIHVSRPEIFPGMVLSRSLPTRDLYVGEPVRVDYEWKSPLPLIGYRALQLYLPLFYDPGFKVRSVHGWILGDDKAAIGLPVANTRIIARYSHKKEGSKFINSVSFPKIIIPQKPGEYVLDPATLLASYVDPPSSYKRQRGWSTNYPSYFNNNFFEGVDGEGFKKYYVASPQQKIRVLPLPLQGKPKDFMGEVGARTIHVTASPKVVAAGDPITLTVEVGGLEFPEVMEFPDLEKQPAFQRQFAIPTKRSQGRIKGDKKVFILTLRPRSQDVSVIPSIRLPFFDPKTKSYGVAESKPIPITVKESEIATAYDAKISGAGPLRNLLEENPSGIQANFRSYSSGCGLSKKMIVWLLLILPPSLFLLFVKATSRRRMMRDDPVRLREKEAYLHWKKSVRKLERAIDQAMGGGVENIDEKTYAENLQALDSAVRTYFADKYNLRPYAHTFEEVAEVIEKRFSPKPVPDLRNVEQVYRRCAEKNYRGRVSMVDLKSLLNDVKKWIRQHN